MTVPASEEDGGKIRTRIVSMAASVGTQDGMNADSANARSRSSTVVDNPMPHRLPEGENAAPLEVTGTTASDKLVIIMVGLPATGEFCCKLASHESRVILDGSNL
jgi:hypothetical protein